MADHSSIEWTDATWNPVRGCTKVSPGCKHCYAETFAERFRGVEGHPYEEGFDPRIVPEKLDEPTHWKKPRFVFVNSMSDLFHEKISFPYIAACFGVMAGTPQHTYQVLTKRADRLLAFFRWLERGAEGRGGLPEVVRCEIEAANRVDVDQLAPPWPLPNVWLGVSVESQEYADKRIPDLLACPAEERFLSIEPLLGPVILQGGNVPNDPAGPWPEGPLHHRMYLRGNTGDERINWVIVGGESGPGAREMDTSWVRSIRDQCLSAKVPFFFKQWGGVRKKVRGRILDGRTWDEMPARAAKGGR